MARLGRESPDPKCPGYLRYVLFAAGYLAAAWLSRWLMLAPDSGLSLWAPGGLFLAVLLQGNTRHWPHWVAAALPADLAGSVGLFDVPVPAALGFALAHGLEALAGAFLVRRFLAGPLQLDSLRDVLALAGLGAALAPAFGATVGAAVSAATGREAFSTAWLGWWAADGLGILLASPLALTAFEIRGRWPHVEGGRRIEGAAMALAFAVLSWFVFSGGFPFAYILMLPLLWGTLRFEMIGVSATMGILAVAALQGTATHLGLFADPAFDPLQRQWLVQSFLAVIAFSALLVAALSRQRRQALLSMKNSYRGLEARVRERTAELRESETRLQLALKAAGAGIWECVPATGEFFASDQALALYGIPPGTAMNYDRALAAVHPDDRGKVEAALRQTLATGEAFRLEMRTGPAEGRPRWLAAHGELRQDRGRPRLVGLVQDITERKEAEERAALDRLRFRLALDAAYVVSFEWNIPRDEVRRRQSTEPSLPAIPEGSVGTFAEVCAAVHPEDRERFAARVRVALNRGDGRYENEFRVVRPDGSMAWLHERGRLLRDAQGRPEWLVGLAQDITLRKQAEDALREQKERYQLIAAGAGEGIWDWEVSGGRIYVSPRWKALHGYAEDAELDYEEAWNASIHPDDRPRVLAALQAHFEGKTEFFDEEYRICCQDGSSKWVKDRGIAHRDGSGRVVRMAGSASDITGRKRAEEALQESLRRERQRAEELETIFDLVPMGLALSLDPRGENIRGNRENERMFGLPPSAELSKAGPAPARFRIFQEGRELAVNELPMQRAIRGEPIFGQVLDVVREDGTPLTVYAKARPLFDEAGQPRGAVGAFLDISALKQAENALREADRRKDEFLAMLAHELRNPLAPIRNALHVLRKSEDDSPAARERTRALLTMVERQVRHLIRLVDDLLEVSRISRGKINLRLETADLATVIGHALDTSQPLIKTRGHTVETCLPREPVPLHADPVRLCQVFANLLNNAAKYTPPGGTIRIVAERRNSEAVVRVTDTGEGIPADILPRVFDLFTQADRSIDRAQGGLGIGLSLVRQLVEMHGGKVEARSDGPGKGSEFIVYLPLAARAVEAERPKVAPKPGAFAG